jgi:hypothetical protein
MADSTILRSVWVALCLAGIGASHAWADGPDLAWATYLGGGATDYADGIAMDATGNVYVAGGTSSTDFPVPGGWDTSLAAAYDAFLAKFSSAGTLLWATYLGGSQYDYAYGTAVDSGGDVYLTDKMEAVQLKVGYDAQ